MVAIDNREGPCWLLVQNPPLFAYYSGLVFNLAAAACLSVCIGRVQVAKMTALQFLFCDVYSAETDFASESLLMTRDIVLMYLPSVAVADIAELGLHHVVRGILFDAPTSIVVSSACVTRTGQP